MTLCVTSSAPLDTIPGQLQCTRDTQHSSSPMTNRRSNQARSCRCCSCSVELKLRFRSRRNHSVTFRWTVSQSRRRLTNYNNNLPKRCYKLQRQHPFAAPIPPSPSFSLHSASTRSNFLVKHHHEICLKICSCSPKRRREIERKKNSFQR